MSKNFVDFASAVAWPTVILLALIYFRTPIEEILVAATRRLDAISKLTLGPLSVEIRSYLQNTGDLELQEALSKMTRPAFRLLLQCSEKNTTRGLCYEQAKGEHSIPVLGISFGEQYEAVRELERLGLAIATEPLWEFEAYFERLPSYTIQRRAGYISGWVSKAQLADEDIERIRKMSWGLTDLGQRAYDAVLTVVVRQISTR